MKQRYPASLSMTLAAFLVFGTSAGVALESTSASDVIDKSHKAMEELESFSTTVKMEQTVADNIGDEGTLHSSSTVEQDVTLNPFAMYQKSTTATTYDDGEEEYITLESYWMEDEVYQQEPDGTWVKMVNDDFGMLLEGLIEHPSYHLEDMEAFADEMIVTEEDGYYVLTYEGDGETFIELTNDLYATMDEEDEEGMGEIWDEIVINSLVYEMRIDKETYFLTSVIMDLDMDLEEGEDNFNIIQTVNSEFYNFNEVGTITVPDEVKDNATDMEEQYEGDEMADTATNYPIGLLAGLSLAGLGGAFIFARRKVIV